MSSDEGDYGVEVPKATKSVPKTKPAENEKKPTAP